MFCSSFSLPPVEMHRFERRACNRELRIIVREKGNDRSFMGHCTTISRAGFAARVAKNLAVGQIVVVQFNHQPSDTVIQLSAKVRRAGPVYGLEFVAPGDRERATLTRFFREMLDVE